LTGSSRSQAAKRTNGNIKSNILIWLRRGQSGVTCQVPNSPSFTSTRALGFKLMRSNKTTPVFGAGLHAAEVPEAEITVILE
jgi:hypothetical protein